MSSKQSDLDSIQKLVVDQQFQAALTQTRALLAQHSDDPELLYMQAVCQRYLGEHQAALHSLETLKALAPEHGRAHQEEGHNFRALNRNPEALRAYTRATHYNPALVASLKAQRDILQHSNDSVALAAVDAQLREVQALPKPLLAARDLLAQNKLARAESVCRKFLQQVPQNVPGMRILAEIGVRLGILDDAEYLLESAVQFEPENIAARIEYIQILRKRQKFTAALREADALLQREPDNPRYQSIYAVECMQCGKFDDALVYFERILQALPADPVTLTSKGHALKTRGQPDAAISAYREAIAAHRWHGEAYYSLANLKTYNFTDSELETLLAVQDNSNLGFMDRVYVHFALGKAFEDRHEYQQSFFHYERGNSLKKSQSRYQAEQISADFEAQTKVCTAEFFEQRKSWGCPQPDPIFIVGLPRAGSTLLEQILSSHSQVDGTLELPNILSLSQHLRRRKRDGQAPDYPAILGELTADEFREFGETYIRDTRIHRQGAPLFIDKMPNNFRHLGLIRLMFPNAKVIDARRNPLACCFSAYKQLFADGQEFSYSLGDLGHYYRDYVALMEHWDSVLPGYVLRVENEALIADLETEVRRLLEFCGLPFEEGCLYYYQTERDIRTPSSEQVRKPISRAGVDQWRNYEEFLAPLKSALGPLAELSEQWSDAMLENDSQSLVRE
jgi:tetratricopeptide (TPR) repeat protein